MPSSLAELAAAREDNNERQGISVVTGVVMNNCDLLAQGKVSVRIPSTGQEVSARICAPGGGADRGLQTPPQPDDEVLVAIVDGNPPDSYVLGGLWNTRDRPPVSNPAQLPHTTRFRTGLVPGTGHEIEFDDVLQSVKITSSTGQSISMSPEAISLETTGGTLSIDMNVLMQTISIKSQGVLELSAPVVKISGDIGVDISGGTAFLNGDTVCSVQGKLVKIN